MKSIEEYKTLEEVETRIMELDGLIEVAPSIPELKKLDNEFFELSKKYETMTGSGNDQQN